MNIEKMENELTIKQQIDEKSNNQIQAKMYQDPEVEINKEISNQDSCNKANETEMKNDNVYETDKFLITSKNEIEKVEIKEDVISNQNSCNKTREAEIETDNVYEPDEFLITSKNKIEGAENNEDIQSYQKVCENMREAEIQNDNVCEINKFLTTSKNKNIAIQTSLDFDDTKNCIRETMEEYAPRIHSQKNWVTTRKNRTVLEEIVKVIARDERKMQSHPLTALLTDIQTKKENLLYTINQWMRKNYTTIHHPGPDPGGGINTTTAYQAEIHRAHFGLFASIKNNVISVM
jgi:hypothetical protein